MSLQMHRRLNSSKVSLVGQLLRPRLTHWGGRGDRNSLFSKDHVVQKEVVVQALAQGGGHGGAQTRTLQSLDLSIAAEKRR